MACGERFHISIVTQPSGQFCTVRDGYGVVGFQDPTQVGIACVSESAIVGYSNPSEHLAVAATGDIYVGASSSGFTVYRFAEDATLDTVFGGGDGMAHINLVGSIYVYQGLRDLAPMQDGGAVLVGLGSDITTCNDSSVFTATAVRVDDLGEPDTDFADEGILQLNYYGMCTAAYNTEATAAVVQSGGEFVIGGETANGTWTHPFLARYDSTGVLDTTFGTSGKVSLLGLSASQTVRKMIVLPDDGLLVLTCGGIFCDELWRFDKDGAIDKEFGTNGVRLFTQANVYDIAVDAAGRIICAAQNNNPSRLAVIRLEADGSNDTSFGNNGKTVLYPPWEEGDVAGETAGAVIALDSGHILLGGGVPMENGEFSVGNAALLARLDDDGELDVSFHGDGFLTIHPIVWGGEDFGIRDLARRDGVQVTALIYPLSGVNGFSLEIF